MRRVNPIVKKLTHAKRLLFPSAAEARFYNVMGRFWFMRYNVQREYPARGYFLDYALPQYRLAFEIDGARYHTNTIKDWERDQHLAKSGWTIVRIPARDLWQDPEKVKRLVNYHVRGH